MANTLTFFDIYNARGASWDVFPNHLMLSTTRLVSTLARPSLYSSTTKKRKCHLSDITHGKEKIGARPANHAIFGGIGVRLANLQFSSEQCHKEYCRITCLTPCLHH
jgi:hypothetical protein